MTAPAVLVEFAAQPGAAEGDYVVCRAPVVCRAGDYAFKDAPPFRLTPEDIRREAEDFRPVPIDDTHGSVGSVFHGRLGEFAAIEPAADFSQFGGLVRLPQWLYKLYKGAAVPLSATFDRLTKRLKSVALVADPRIPDAHARLEAIEAAFAAADAPPEATTVPTNTTETKPPAPDLAARLAEMEKREADWKREREDLSRRAEENAAEFAAERDRRLLGECAAFAAREGAGRGKDTRDLLAEFRFALATADREHGEATFSREGAEPRKGSLLAQLDALVAKFNGETPSVLDKDAYRGGAAFANDPGEKPGDEFKAVDAAVDAEIERQRKARGQQTNGRA